MNLDALARKYGSDKHDHGFCPFYEGFFGPVREDVEAVLEIGIADGASIRMWLEYFPNAKVYGLDNGMYGDRTRWPTDEPRFEAFLGDQGNAKHLAKVAENGPFDVIIDDGSHTMHDQQISLSILLPHTRFYVVEDLQTSFMDRIDLYGDGKLVESYPTGVVLGPTTHELLDTLRQGQGMAGGGLDMATSMALLRASIHIFDRDGDHKHMTAIIERTADAEDR